MIIIYLNNIDIKRNQSVLTLANVKTPLIQAIETNNMEILNFCY